MTIEDLTKEIEQINHLIEILKVPVKNDIHFIYKTYIETEQLAKTKKKIDEKGIVQENGNKYQINDISELISSNRTDVDEDTRKLAQKILNRNKIKRWQNVNGAHKKQRAS